MLSLHRLMNILPLLEDVQLNGTLATNDVILFMNDMKALKIFIIESPPTTRQKATDFAVIRSRLKGRWHCEKFDRFFSYKFTRISKCLYD